MDYQQINLSFREQIRRIIIYSSKINNSSKLWIQNKMIFRLR